MLPAWGTHTIMQICNPQPGPQKSSGSLTLSAFRNVLYGNSNHHAVRKAKLSHQERPWKKTQATSPQPASTTICEWMNKPSDKFTSGLWAAWGLRHHWVKTSHPHHILSKLLTHKIGRFWKNLLCSYSNWNTTNKFIAKFNEHLPNVTFTWFFEMLNTFDQNLYL